MPAPNTSAPATAPASARPLVPEFQALEARAPGYYLLLGAFALLAAAGGLAAWHMEHEGHHVTGMDNQIVWGLPHVAAIFMILVASGALNVAGIASVFQKVDYKPLARLSGLLALVFLAGGLAVLVLDLGRPDRLIVALTYYNFKSIFAWNIFLYTGFALIVIVYLWTMFERRMTPYTRASGLVALVWRLALTTGTGAIFGFLVARQAYDAAVMAPLFIAMSLAFGAAVFILVLAAAGRLRGAPAGDYIIFKLRNLLGVFVALVAYFVLAQHLTNLYATEHHGIEAFILRDGGAITWLFWAGQIALGTAAPLALFFIPPFSRRRAAALLGCVLVLVGAVAQLYVIIIGGQAYPLVLFPGMAESSAFFDGAIATYAPSLPEILLGVGGVGFALAALVFLLAVLDFLPRDLSDAWFKRARAAAGAD